MSHISDPLREARQLYGESPSHASYGQYLPPGTYCVLTAINEGASRRRPWASSSSSYSCMTALARAANLIEPTSPNWCASTKLIRWNANTSTEEVLAAFDRAIAAEEAKSNAVIH